MKPQVEWLLLCAVLVTNTWGFWDLSWKNSNTFLDMCCSACQQSLVYGDTNTTSRAGLKEELAHRVLAPACKPCLETLRGGDAPSMGGDFGGCPQLSAEQGFPCAVRAPRVSVPDPWAALAHCERLTPEGSTATGWHRHPAPSAATPALPARSSREPGEALPASLRSWLGRQRVSPFC